MPDLRAPIVALVGCLWLASGCGGPGVGDGDGDGALAAGALAAGAIAPEIDVAPLDGKAFEGGDGPLLVNFWATWCAACKAATPELQGLAESGEVEVVGLALDTDPTRVAVFAESHRIDYPLALDDGRLFERFGGLAIPHSVLLDADRRVLAVYRGTIRRQDVVRDLARAGRAP